VNDIAHIAIAGTLSYDRCIISPADVFVANGHLIERARFRNLFVHLPTFEAMQSACQVMATKRYAADVAESCLGRFSRNLNEKARGDYKIIRNRLKILRDRRDTEAHTEQSATHEDARFTFYARNMMRTIVKSNPEAFKSVRVGSNFLPFIDSIIVEFVQMVAAHVLIHTQILGVQTVSRKLVSQVVRTMMITPANLMERRISSVSPKPLTEKVARKDDQGKPIMDADGHAVSDMVVSIRQVAEMTSLSISALIDSVVSMDAPATSDTKEARRAKKEADAQAKDSVRADKSVTPAAPHAAPVAPASSTTAAAFPGRRGRVTK
jgi:hypothetical protein